jgi:hypothetical protein
MLRRTPTLFNLVEIALTIAVPSASLEQLTVVPAELGDQAGLVGSANLAKIGVSIIA